MVIVEALRSIHDVETGNIIKEGYRAEVVPAKAERWAAQGLVKIISKKAYKTKEEKFKD